MTQLGDLATPELNAAASFHRDDAFGELAEKIATPARAGTSYAGRTANLVGPMNVEHILRQIEPDRDNLRHDRSSAWIVADPASCGWFRKAIQKAASGRSSLTSWNETYAPAERLLARVQMPRSFGSRR